MTRLGDIILAMVLLFLCLPVIVLASFVVWLEAASLPLVRVGRVTRGGRIVRLWRFGVTRPTRLGPKLTVTGALLCRWHLERTPQLLNVIAGDISLLGARPETAPVRKVFAER